MDYVIARTHVVDHERFLDAGSQARDLWLWGMLYAGKHESDGAISMSAVLASPWGYGGKANIKAATRLVEVGLWERTEKGFQILKWEEMGNKTKAQLEEAREVARKKKANQRVRLSRPDSSPPPSLGDTPGDSPGCPPDVPNSTSYSTSKSDLGSREGEPERETAGARYQAAYAAGIARGKCSPWVWPGGKYAEWDLGKIIKGHGLDGKQRPYRGDQLLRFIEATAAEFASSVIETKTAQYYSAFEPRGCLKWLNEQDLAEEARRVG